ncbi:MAG: ABC transporter permease [Candidatus Omnitrophica bacterium]|nr:ABC transporter permease [Candidatus Omnitrophota bacterium]
MSFLIKIGGYLIESLQQLGKILFFISEILSKFLRNGTKLTEVMKQIYSQGVQSIGIIALTSLAMGMVLAIQSVVILSRFGAKEYVAQLVSLSLVRELSPVLGSIIFAGKAGSKMAAEISSMKVSEQLLATRAMGVDPVEYFIIPRIVACVIVLPILIVISEILGVFGGFIIGVWDANIPYGIYLHKTVIAITLVDFIGGMIKTLFFALIISIICCFEGYQAKGGSIGVGEYTTKSVALCCIYVISFNFILTKIILTFWG